jgi:anaerobic selenocysteine-containing dehydrogenase
VYSHPNGAQIKKALKSNVKLSVSSSISLDETSNSCQFVTPDHHYLESWCDYQPVGSTFTLGQPTISPVFDTRQMQESLLTWAGAIDAYSENTMKDNGIYGQEHSVSPFYNYIKSKWSVTDKEFNTYLHDGFVIKDTPTISVPGMIANTDEIASEIEKSKSAADGIEITLIEKTGMLGGVLSNNPLVQELPDPISKVTWHNYIALSKMNAVRLGINDNDVVNITVGETKMVLPAIVQPGQANGTASIHLGFGRTVADPSGS